MQKNKKRLLYLLFIGAIFVFAAGGAAYADENALFDEAEEIPEQCESDHENPISVKDELEIEFIPDAN